MQIELDQKEAGNLMQLIDIAVKAGGLQAAAAALPIAAKIQQAAQQSAPQPADDQP
jgi:hypothetical protein